MFEKVNFGSLTKDGFIELILDYFTYTYSHLSIIRPGLMIYNEIEIGYVAQYL